MITKGVTSESGRLGYDDDTDDGSEAELIGNEDARKIVNDS